MRPLAGVKVLDLSRILAGPYCSMLLGDLGAEVTKIESLEGDDTRSWGPPFVGSSALYFWSVNRNKRSVCVNFRRPEGRALIEDLARGSDVLVENFLPRSLEKYGLDFASLKRAAPRLIYCSISGFGQEGPMSQCPGYDVVAASIGGLLQITGPTDGPPCRVGVAVTDLMTGLLAQTSILAALVNKSKDENFKACHIDCNLLSSQISMLFHIGANYLTKKIEPSRIGTSHNSIVPYQGFLTHDSRYFIVGAGNDKQFSELCSLLNMTELSKDPRYLTNAYRVLNRKELISLLEKVFCTKTLKYWADLFKNSSLPNGPVNNMEEVFSNPQVQFLSDTLINTWSDDQGEKVSVPGFPIQCSSWTLANSPLRPPMLGEHTAEVLRTKLHYSDEKINELDKIKAIYVRK